MSTAADDRKIEEWFRRLRWALERMPAPERDDIVEETRAHVKERIDGGASAAEVLASFGPAETYARQFLDEMELTSALSSTRSGDLLSVIARRVHRSLVALVAFLAVLFMGGFALGSVVTAIYKIADPEHSGLWVGSGDFFIGQIDNPAGHHELLGNWIYPFTVLAVAIAWVLGRLVLIWAARTIRGR
ncbi:MAG: HAAS signaling domain-containing protein [Caulobacteraceae bacterium]